MRCLYLDTFFFSINDSQIFKDVLVFNSFLNNRLRYFIKGIFILKILRSFDQSITCTNDSPYLQYTNSTMNHLNPSNYFHTSFLQFSRKKIKPIIISDVKNLLDQLHNQADIKQQKNPFEFLSNHLPFFLMINQPN